MSYGSRSRRKILAGLLMALALGVVGYLRRQAVHREHSAGPLSQQRFCVRVIDGDTIELDGGERVRLIGVDTPETVDPRRPVQYFGKEASAFTRRMVEGKDVRIERDQESRDQYGRTLAYVYLPDGTFLNAEIIRQGYGHAYVRFPYRYQRQFVDLEREARENGRGLWAR
jgi:micrococcal nuclease